MAHIDGSAAAAAAGCILAASSLVHASRAVAEAPCDTLCQVNSLGWRVIDAGPPLWLESGKGGPRIDVAVAEPGTPSSDPVSWAKSQLAGPLGTFGALGACRGKFPAAPGKVTMLECSVPAERNGPRHAALFAVATAAGVEVIGAIAPLNVDLNPLNLSALLHRAHEERDALTPAGAVRAAIATVTGAAYYASPEAGAGGPAIEGVYHVWNAPPPVNPATPLDTGAEGGADFVLFKNGEVWRNPGAGPHDIDPLKFKEARWLDTGSWRRQAGGFAITLHGQDAMLLPDGKFRRYEPAAEISQQQVDGLWQGSPGQALWLHADGRFELKGPSALLSLTHTAEHASTPRPLKPPLPGGHYRIDGYTLHLTYDDGRDGSALFYWAGDLNRDRYALCIINGAQWLGERAR